MGWNGIEAEKTADTDRWFPLCFMLKLQQILSWRNTEL